MKAFVAFFLAFFLVGPANARDSATSNQKKQTTFSIFGGVGPGLSVPGPLRLRIESFEFGTYSQSLGFAAVFRNGRTYGEFGLGIGLVGKMGFGPLGALGFEVPLIWIFDLRGEVSTYAGLNGLVTSMATLGLSLNF